MTKKRKASCVVMAAAFAVLMAGASPAGALEKQARAFDDDRADDWNAALSVLIRYYNTCTGWIWMWGGFADGDRIGVVMNVPQNLNALLQTAVLTYSGGPAGYGFTGTIEIHATDANDCPTASVWASQPFLFGHAQFIVNAWGGLPVPAEFVAVVKIASGVGVQNPGKLATEHPAAGPTGPPACGTCYPANRVNHSFFYGSASVPLCPGSPFNDGVCDAQLLCEAVIACRCPVEAMSWAGIKCLYK